MKSSESTIEHTNRMLAVGMSELVPQIARQVAKEEITTQKQSEDVRAVRRNRNRGLALLVTMMFEMMVPLAVTALSLPPVVLTYEVLIITLPDALITGYAYIRRY